MQGKKLCVKVEIYYAFNYSSKLGEEYRKHPLLRKEGYSPLTLSQKETFETDECQYFTVEKTLLSKPTMFSTAFVSEIQYLVLKGADEKLSIVMDVNIDSDEWVEQK